MMNLLKEDSSMEHTTHVESVTNQLTKSMNINREQKGDDKITHQNYTNFVADAVSSLGYSNSMDSTNK